MIVTRLRLGIAGTVLLLLLSASAVGLLAIPKRNKQQPPSQQATQTQKTEFLALYQKYQSIYSTARATGDVSAFPTLFYNDPAFVISELAPDCIPIIARYSDQIASVLLTHGAESQVPTPGLLSCQIADIFYLHESSSAWEAIQTQAVSEGHPPSISDLPDGLEPVDLPSQLGQSKAIEVAIQSATVQGNHATVKYSVPAYGSLYEHMLLTERDGTWYISGIWTSGNP